MVKESLEKLEEMNVQLRQGLSLLEILNRASELLQEEPELFQDAMKAVYHYLSSVSFGIEDNLSAALMEFDRTAKG